MTHKVVHVQEYLYPPQKTTAVRTSGKRVRLARGIERYLYHKARTAYLSEKFKKYRPVHHD